MATRTGNMAEKLLQNSIADWEAEFSQNSCAVQEPYSTAQIARCRELFGAISAQTRQHREAGWLDRPGYEALRALCHHGLLLTRLAYPQVSQLDRVEHLTVSVDLLEQLLIENLGCLQVIDSQMELIKANLFLAEMLRPVVEGMLARDGFPVHRLEPLLDRLRADSRPETAARLIPWPGVSCEQILAAAGWPCPWFFAQSIQQARWTAVTHAGLKADEAYPLTNLLSAALLSDLGLLISAGSQRWTPERSDRRALQAFIRHPDISAAVVSGIHGASPEWAQLVGQHHERLDGSGFPHGLSGRQLSPAAQGLAAALRWSELLSQTSVARTADEALRISVQALWRETVRGGFPAELVIRMISAVRSDWAAMLDSEHSAGRLDPHHLQHGPHFTAENPADSWSHHDPLAPPSSSYQRRVHRSHRPKTPVLLEKYAATNITSPLSGTR